MNILWTTNGYAPRSSRVRVPWIQLQVRVNIIESSWETYSCFWQTRSLAKLAIVKKIKARSVNVWGFEFCGFNRKLEWIWLTVAKKHIVVSFPSFILVEWWKRHNSQDRTEQSETLPGLVTIQDGFWNLILGIIVEMIGEKKHHSSGRVRSKKRYRLHKQWMRRRSQRWSGKPQP